MRSCPWSCFDFLRDLCGGDSAMGATASSTLTEEQKELQDLRGRLGPDFELLAAAFSRMRKSDDTPNVIHESKLERCFGMDVKLIQNIPQDSDLRSLIGKFGSTLTAVLFKPSDKLVSWTAFLKGYDTCCRQTLVSTRLKFLLFFFHTLKNEGEGSSATEIVPSCNPDDNLKSPISPRVFKDFLWICWLMMFYKKLKDEIELPSLEPLVQGAFHTLPGKGEVSLKYLYSWMLSTIPNIGNSLVDYVQSCLFEDENAVPGTFSRLSGHLTPERLWCLGLSLTDKTGEILLSALFDDSISFLYRSPVHGKGMNRLWSLVEGYKETVMVLISGIAPEDSSKKWLLGAIIPGGLQNKSDFYGNSNSCLICFESEYIVLHPTGKEKNYVYSHKNVPDAGYNSRPMPDGIGFGGSVGNERIWLNDDFSSLTLRHHAVDKTYQAGYILSYQGYAPLCCQVLEVEVWGLGGRTAEEKMTTYQQREKLFAEQRRKVDLRAFGNWQDSPEKMMMDMVSNPNRPEREDR